MRCHGPAFLISVLKTIILGPTKAIFKYSKSIGGGGSAVIISKSWSIPSVAFSSTLNSTLTDSGSICPYQPQ